MYNLASPPANIPRSIMPLVKVIKNILPDAHVVARGSAYEDLVFQNPENANLISKQELLDAQIALTKTDWVNVLFTEGNMVQEYASAHFSFSNKGYNQTQLSLYAQKHAKAKGYLYSVDIYQGTLEEAIANVEVPPMILEEATITGDAPYDLALAIVKNYLDSNDYLTEYFGKLEGERRLAKRRILACATIQELEQLTWADWPKFIPPTIDIGD